MDESLKRGEATPSKDQWHKDKGPTEGLRATGVFGAEPSIEIGPGPVWEPVRDVGDRGSSFGEATQFDPAGSHERLQEPIVHKVVVGGGSATAPINILELLRTSSPAVESAPGPEVATPQSVTRRVASGPSSPPAPAPTSGSQPSQSSEGFTQLLRTLSGDSSPASAAEQPAAVKRTVVSSDSRVADMESGFTSLLRTLNPDDGGDRPEKRPDPPAQSRSTPSSEGGGGFTSLLQGFSETDPNPGERQLNPRALCENAGPTSPGFRAIADPLTAPAPASGQAAPGAFTQLFNALTPKATNPVMAEPEATNPGAANVPTTYAEHNPVSRPSGEQTSFTQLISTIGESSSGPSPYSDERKSVLDDLPRERNPGREGPVGSHQLQTGITGWSPATAPRPQPESSFGSGGLTHLLRTLNEPAKGPETSSPYPPAGETPAPSPAGGSLFTQTYKRLDVPAERLSSAPPPTYSSPSRPSATQPFPSPLTGKAFVDPGSSIPVVPDLPAGPSDVTRILDASKLREMQRLGVSAAAPIDPAASAQPLASQSQASLTPAPPNLQSPPAPALWQPPQYAPPTPMPQMSAPAAPPAMGKMQQYLPLLLIMIIFLLVVILVTMVFLLKR